LENKADCISIILEGYGRHNDKFTPLYIQDISSIERKKIEREFETEILPKIKECLEIVKNQRKKNGD
jgi:hypothetical protein